MAQEKKKGSQSQRRDQGSSSATRLLRSQLAGYQRADDLGPAGRRFTAAVALIVAATSFAAMGAFPISPVLIGANIIFGFTVGNVTTLSPIIVRQEFGAKAFGLVFGVASCAIKLVAALGPSFYGVLYDAFGNYIPALISAAMLDIFAATIVLASRQKPTSS